MTRDRGLCTSSSFVRKIPRYITLFMMMCLLTVSFLVLSILSQIISSSSFVRKIYQTQNMTVLCFY